MKKIILAILMVSTMLSASSLRNIYGTWVITSLDERGTTVFGKDVERNRGGEFTLEFNKQKRVQVVEKGSVYEFAVKGNKLYISDKKRYLQNGMRYNKKYHVDILTESGRRGNCIVVKYTQKGLNGYYRKEGYKMCKVENYPQPTYTRQPYKF